MGSSTGTGIGSSTCTSTSNGTSTGIGSSTCTSTSNGTSTGTGSGAQDVDYCLTTNGLVRFRNMIYVPDSSELKKVILREFLLKPYLRHPGY